MPETIVQVVRAEDRRKSNKGRWWDRRKNPDRRKAKSSRNYEYIGMSQGGWAEVE